MPNWKKLVVSGSNASLNNLTVNNAVTASAFIGDGSGLTGITVEQSTTVEDTFSNVSTRAITHNFGTKNVLVNVYDGNDNMIIPQGITTTNDNQITITFAEPTSGRAVVVKGGHLVSGSSNSNYDLLTNIPSGIVSSSTQISSDISGSFNSLSGSIATRFDGLTSDYTELTNIPSGIVSSSAQITTLTSYTENFSSQTAVTASHNLGTKNVTVQVYGSDDFMMFPTSIKTHDTNNVYVQFNSSRSGRIVITK